MLGFLFKILLVAALVAGIGGYVMVKSGGGIPKDLSSLKSSFNLSSLPVDQNALQGIKSMKADQVLTSISSTLDALVTHPGKNGGPIVLGVNVTNESLNTVVDVLQNLPPEQVAQIRNAICASPSSN